MFLTVVVAAAAVAVLAGLLAGSAAASGGGGVSPSGTASGKDPKAVPASAGESAYAQIWNSTSRADRRWAKRTSMCESGGDPKAIGGGGLYRGAFQFMKATWRTSPKSPGGDPIRYTYRTQAVIAILLKKRDGADHWPVCG
jgi:hypothetical protein